MKLKPDDIIHCVACEADRQRALAVIESLRECDPDSEEGHERDLLLEMISQWEAKGRPAYRSVR